MIMDIATIVWKEMKEILQPEKKMKGGIRAVLIFALVFGVLMPLQGGTKWVTDSLTLIQWAWLPFLLSSNLSADLISGETERHSIETLLASRISDKALYLGKLSSAIVYGWGMTLMCSLIGLITVNIANWSGKILFYPPTILAGLVVITFLVAVLASSLGVLVSMHSPTVKQAQQTFSVAFLIFFIPLFMVQYIPEAWKTAMKDAFVAADWKTIIILVLIGVCVLDVVFVATGLIRFKRHKLLLN